MLPPSGPGKRTAINWRFNSKIYGIGFEQAFCGYTSCGSTLLKIYLKIRLLLPFLTLLISGGHCLLINAKSLGDYEILGQTLDDAVGEAFIKWLKYWT